MEPSLRAKRSNPASRDDKTNCCDRFGSLRAIASQMTIRRMENHDAKETFPTRPHQGLGRPRARPCSPRPQGPRHRSRSRSRRPDRGRAERRQGGASTRRWIFRSARNWARPSRRSIPASPCRSSAPARRRLFQRVDAGIRLSNIRAADMINSSDASHFITWKKNNWLAPFVTEDIASISCPSIAIPTACPRRRGSICRRSPTTPIW